MDIPSARTTTTNNTHNPSGKDLFEGDARKTEIRLHIRSSSDPPFVGSVLPRCWAADERYTNGITYNRKRMMALRRYMISNMTRSEA